MIEPSLALQTAVRGTLLAHPAVTDLVQPERIRAGSTRPDKFPCVVLSGASTQYLGRASGDQHLARVNVDLNIWAIEDGPDTAKAIGFAVSRALIGMADEQDDWQTSCMLRHGHAHVRFHQWNGDTLGRSSFVRV